MLDSGATVSLVNADIIQPKFKNQIDASKAKNLSGLAENIVPTMGLIPLDLSVNNQEHTWGFQVIKDTIGGGVTGIIGRDFLKERVMIDFINDNIKFSKPQTKKDVTNSKNTEDLSTIKFSEREKEKLQSELKQERELVEKMQLEIEKLNIQIKLGKECPTSKQFSDISKSENDLDSECDDEEDELIEHGLFTFKSGQTVVEIDIETDVSDLEKDEPIEDDVESDSPTIKQGMHKLGDATQVESEQQSGFL